jgi:TatD DNase family protein
MARASVTRKLVDIGANLTDPMFRGVYNGSQKHSPDLNLVIDRALEVGVQKIIVTGGSLEESRAALEVSKSSTSLYSTVGCHPTRCLELEASPDLPPHKYIEEMTRIATENKGKVVAIGEFGLDYDRLQFCPKEIQLKYFEAQLSMAESTRLPLFLHCRNAAKDLIEVLTRNRDKFVGGVVHSFDGSLEEAEQFLGMNLYIGINGCSLKTDSNLEVVSKLPKDRILIETDAPWCEIKSSHASSKHVKTQFESKKKEKFESGLRVKGRNEPANLVQVLEAVASVRGEDAQDLGETTFENALKLFSLSS